VRFLFNLVVFYPSAREMRVLPDESLDSMVRGKRSRPHSISININGCFLRPQAICVTYKAIQR